jgi:inhibitor of cysteine peptidase
MLCGNCRYNQQGILSIVFYNYQYSGGAHGLTVQSSKTFDLLTGKQYKLQDLFVDGADYVGIITQGVKQAMQDQGLSEALLSPFRSIRADQDFYLTNDALVVYFQAYEYFPYAAGIPEFGVDYAALQEYFTPGFGVLK